jgi:hypothetical protein
MYNPEMDSLTQIVPALSTTPLNSRPGFISQVPVSFQSSSSLLIFCLLFLSPSRFLTMFSSPYLPSPLARTTTEYATTVTMRLQCSASLSCHRFRENLLHWRIWEPIPLYKQTYVRLSSPSPFLSCPDESRYYLTRGQCRSHTNGRCVFLGEILLQFGGSA